MTEQFTKTNINSPRIAKSFAATGALTAVDLTFDDDIVTVDTTLGIVDLTLPLASQFQSWQISIKALNAGTTGNLVVVRARAGEQIDDVTFVNLAEDNQAIILESDGTNWKQISSFGAPADTWAETLEAGNVSGGFEPTISDGDALVYGGTGTGPGVDTTLTPPVLANPWDAVLRADTTLAPAETLAFPLGLVDPSLYSPALKGTATVQIDMSYSLTTGGVAETYSFTGKFLVNALDGTIVDTIYASCIDSSGVNAAEIPRFTFDVNSNILRLIYTSNGTFDPAYFAGVARISAAAGGTV